MELGRFGEIGIASPRKFLNIRTGGILYVDGKIINPPNYKISTSKFYQDHIRNYINSGKWIKITAYKTLGRMPSFNCENIINEIQVNDLLANDFASKRINQLLANKSQIQLMAKKRREKWEEVNYELRNFEIKPIYSVLNTESSPWACPLYVDRNDEKLEIIRYCVGRKIISFPWPYIDQYISVLNSSFINRWEKLICIPLD